MLDLKLNLKLDGAVVDWSSALDGIMTASSLIMDWMRPLPALSIHRRRMSRYWSTPYAGRVVRFHRGRRWRSCVWAQRRHRSKPSKARGR